MKIFFLYKSLLISLCKQIDLWIACLVRLDNVTEEAGPVDEGLAGQQHSDLVLVLVLKGDVDPEPEPVPDSWGLL